MSPADPARISRHSGHSAQPAVPPREAGALYPRKNHGKVPPPLQQDPRDPPHSHGNAPVAHCCVSGGVRRVRDGLARAPGALWGRYCDTKVPPVSAVGAAGCLGCRECRECRERLRRERLRREGLEDQFRPGHAEESTRTHSHGNAPVAHCCCSRRASYPNDGPSMLRQQHRWHIDAVGALRATATVAHRYGSVGSDGGPRPRALLSCSHGAAAAADNCP